MKNAATMSGSSDAELLEKAANNKLNSPETDEMQIEGSPFKLVKENGKWFAAWGHGKMTEDFETPNDVLEWIENNYWNFLITVITMAMDSRDLYKINQMMKHAKENAKKEERIYVDEGRMYDEKTLHGEIERLKKEERQNDPLQMLQ